MAKAMAMATRVFVTSMLHLTGTDMPDKAATVNREKVESIDSNDASTLEREEESNEYGTEEDKESYDEDAAFSEGLNALIDSEELDNEEDEDMDTNGEYGK